MTQEPIPEITLLIYDPGQVYVRWSLVEIQDLTGYQVLISDDRGLLVSRELGKNVGSASLAVTVEAGGRAEVRATVEGRPEPPGSSRPILTEIPRVTSVVCEKLRPS
jgi:hypothetical protein